MFSWHQQWFGLDLQERAKSNHEFKYNLIFQCLKDHISYRRDEISAVYSEWRILADPSKGQSQERERLAGSR